MPRRFSTGKSLYSLVSFFMGSKIYVLFSNVISPLLKKKSEKKYIYIIFKGSFFFMAQALFLTREGMAGGRPIDFYPQVLTWKAISVPYVCMDSSCKCFENKSGKFFVSNILW